MVRPATLDGSDGVPRGHAPAPLDPNALLAVLCGEVPPGPVSPATAGVIRWLQGLFGMQPNAGGDRYVGPRSEGGATQLDVPWVSQFDRGSVPRAGDRACYRACRVMMERAGVSIPAAPNDRIQVATSEDRYGRVQTTPESVRAGREYIDRELDAGRPVTAGVSHKDARYNADKITDHFVVITGRGVDEQGRTYYTYNDPATGNQETGTSNRFYVDPTSGNLVHEGSLARGWVHARHTEMSMVVRNQ